MPIVSQELDIFNLFPKKHSVPSSYPISSSEIDYVPSNPSAVLHTGPKVTKVRPIHDANPNPLGAFGGVPIHIVNPMDTQFNAPLSEGNAMGSPEQIIQANYLNQLLPTDVNMNARINETGIYPYFMNTMEHLENMIKSKPMSSSEPNTVQTVESQLPLLEEARNMDLEPGDLKTQMTSTEGSKKRGGARAGAGRKPYTLEAITKKEREGKTLSKGEQQFINDLEKQYQKGVLDPETRKERLATLNRIIRESKQ